MNLFSKSKTKNGKPLVTATQGRDELGRFKKGYVPNPNGRPKLGESLSDKMRDAMAERLNGDFSKLDALIDLLIEKAMSGDLKALDMLLDRGYGKALNKIELAKEKVIDFSWSDESEEMHESTDEGSEITS